MSGERALPEQASLRYLKVEAKRRRAAGEFPTLHLAQLAIAREHGQPSWAALRAAVDAAAAGEGHALAQLRWIAARFAGAREPGWAAPGEDELREHFSARFLAALPPERLIPRLTEVVSELSADLEDLVVTIDRPFLAQGRVAGHLVMAETEPRVPYRVTGVRARRLGEGISDARAASPATASAGPVPAAVSELGPAAASQLGLVGLALAGASAAGPAWATATGWASLEPAEPLSPGHLFPAFQVTMTVTATAVLCLAAAGRLRLDAPANDYLTAVRLSDDAVTVRDLLTHTAGVTDPAEVSAPAAPPLTSVTGPAFACAGKRGTFALSHAGYAALGEVIATVSGLMVDAVDDRGVGVFGRHRDQHALGAAVRSRRGLFLGGEDAGAFQRNVDAERLPGQLGRIALCGNLDLAVADADRVALDRHRAGKRPCASSHGLSLARTHRGGGWLGWDRRGDDRGRGVCGAVPRFHPALRGHRQCGGRGGRLHHRLGAARADIGARWRAVDSRSSRRWCRWRQMCGRRWAATRCSPMRRTGVNIRACRAAAARRSSTSIRCGRRTRSMRWASTTTCRWPTGAGLSVGPDVEITDGPYDAAYLSANIAGGEGYDWYYASDADRIAGTRTPITDGAYGEPWAWRCKDIVGWWSNAHHDRPGGVRRGSATGWVPKSKPIVFTELGCGAVDKGANQPNVFVDPKSAESAQPHFSNGTPDPLAQRQVLRAALSYWADDAHNPASDVYDGRMVLRSTLWTWDARPYPAFPLLADVWTDGANHATGHWMTGRLGGLASDELARAVAADFGVTLGAVQATAPFVHGYLVEAPQTARAALDPLLSASGLAVHDTPDGLALALASRREPVVIDDVVAADGPMISRRRPDPGEAIGQIALSYVDRERSYQSGAVTAIAASAGALESDRAGLVLDLVGARITAERLLRDRLALSDTLEFTAPPSLLALEVGDPVQVAGDVFGVTEIRDGLARRISAKAIPRATEIAIAGGRTGQPESGPSPVALPVIDFAHLPADPDDLAHSRLAAGAYASPWPGSVSVTDDLSGTAITSLRLPATLGELTAPVGTGDIFVWDDGNVLDVTLYAGHLSSKDEVEVLAGGNLLAVETDAGDWEVVAFANAELVAPNHYRLTHLLRGRWGTDYAIGVCAAGNRVLLLDARTKLLPVSAGVA